MCKREHLEPFVIKNVLVIGLMNAVPPRKIIIKNEKLEPLDELAGPYQEDTDVRLTCEAKGGMCATNLCE